MIDQRPNFSSIEVQALLKDLFNISGTISGLPSERDQNFLVSTEKNEKFVLKIANPTEKIENIDLQNKVLNHISNITSFKYSKVISSSDKTLQTFKKNEKKYIIRLLTYIDGIPLAKYKPITEEFLIAYGKFLAHLTLSMQDFSDYDETFASKEFHWDIKHADTVIAKYKSYIKEPKKLNIINYFYSQFLDSKEILDKLPLKVIHNDANNYNVIVSYDKNATQFGIIDLGDMVYSHKVINLAVGIAYAVLEKPDPILTINNIVKGYHEVDPLTEEEIKILFILIATRLTVSVCISAYQQTIEPDNTYLVISEKPAWLTLIQFKSLNVTWIELVLRNTCNYPVNTDSDAIKTWLKINKSSIYPIIVNSKSEIDLIDLSLTSPIGNLTELQDNESISTIIKKFFADSLIKVFISNTGVVRADHLTRHHVFQSNESLLFKNYTLSMDVYSKETTDIFVPFDGEIFKVLINPNELYSIIIEHETDSEKKFYSIFSNLHLTEFDTSSMGSFILKGSLIGSLTNIYENPYPLQYQILCTDQLDVLNDSYLVRDKKIVDSIYFNPFDLFKNLIKDISIEQETLENISAMRNIYLGSSLSISYRKHLHIVRGYMQYLFDSEGRRFLDAVNNVPHVGHSNPNVVKALINQVTVLNTNTRYLHKKILLFAKKLTETLPEKLHVCYFVNSGSEANELALRLAETYTKKTGIAVLNHAYHGNTSKLIDISPYKHNGPGGKGTPDYVHILDLPDPYRGKYKISDSKAGQKYADEAIKEMQTHQDIGTFIFESYPGVAGQIVLAERYLKEVCTTVQQSGIICIADEVQIGLGRVGTHYWGFQTHDVVPDIVTVGKPLGNGHPIGAVITTEEIANTFNNGMEYFNTFGGNPVSCAVGLAVLEEIETQKLQKSALEVGTYLLKLLQTLREENKLIGDVRGKGLYIGIELVRNQQTLEPADWEASYIIERMKDKGVLLSTDGPYHNVLKIKPPLVFTRENALELFNKLELVLQDSILSNTK